MLPRVALKRGVTITASATFPMKNGVKLQPLWTVPDR
jgi:hypothetical protein